MIIPNIWENKIDVPNHQPDSQSWKNYGKSWWSAVLKAGRPEVWTWTLPSLLPSVREFGLEGPGLDESILCGVSGIFRISRRFPGHIMVTWVVMGDTGNIKQLDMIFGSEKRDLSPLHGMFFQGQIDVGFNSIKCQGGHRRTSSAVCPFCWAFTAQHSGLSSETKFIKLTCPWRCFTRDMIWLVVWTPLKNMKVNWDDEIPNIWENKKMFQTTNQWWTTFPKKNVDSIHFPGKTKRSRAPCVWRTAPGQFSSTYFYDITRFDGHYVAIQRNMCIFVCLPCLKLTSTDTCTSYSHTSSYIYKSSRSTGAHSERKWG